MSNIQCSRGKRGRNRKWTRMDTTQETTARKDSLAKDAKGAEKFWVWPVLLGELGVLGER